MLTSPINCTRQIIGGNVYGRAEGNSLYIDRYAGLFVNTLRHLKMPDMELALHNGMDLPVMLKHEVRGRLSNRTTALNQ